MADEYFINVSCTYWTQGLIDGWEAVKTGMLKGSCLLTSSAAVNGGIKMYLAEDLFINDLLQTKFAGVNLCHLSHMEMVRRRI